MTRAALTMLLLLALDGCAAPVARSLPELAEACAVTWVDGRPEGGFADRVLSAMDDGLRRYEEAYGPLPRRVSEVLLYRRSQLPRPAHPDRIGECSWAISEHGEAVIHMAVGVVPPTRVWVHELHHARIGDPEHRDGSWLGVNLFGLGVAQESWK